MIRLITVFFLCAFMLSPAHAEVLTANDLKGSEPIVVKPDAPAIIKLDEDIGSVIIGNPAHARAIVDNPRSIVLMPEAPGSTELVVMDADGNPVLEKKVIVSSVVKGSYLTIKRACINSSADGCAPVSVYYCPDRCHVVQMAGLTEASGGGASGAATEETSTGGGSSSAGPAPVTSGGAMSEGL